MVTIIKLDNFELYEFDYNNADHSELLFELLNDREVSKYLGNVDILIKRILSESDKVLYDSVYVVYRDIPIGLITLDLVSKKFEICLALLSEYRNKSYGSYLLKEFSDYILNNTNITDLYLYINSNNEASKKAALKSDFIRSDRMEYHKKRVLGKGNKYE